MFDFIARENPEYVDALYREYRRDPRAVDERWAFVFSAYELGQTEGHMQITAVFLVPLVALVVLRFLDGSLSARRTTLALGVLLTLQLSFAAEVELT